MSKNWLELIQQNAQKRYDLNKKQMSTAVEQIVQNHKKLEPKKKKKSHMGTGHCMKRNGSNSSWCKNRRHGLFPLIRLFIAHLASR